MRCTCGQTNMICPVHPPLGAPTNSFVAAADFDDSMELISSKELDDLRERLRQREAELEQREYLLRCAWSFVPPGSPLSLEIGDRLRQPLPSPPKVQP